MDDFLAHIDRRPKLLEGDPHNINGPHHPGAETPWLQQKQGFLIQTFLILFLIQRLRIQRLLIESSVSSRHRSLYALPTRLGGLAFEREFAMFSLPKPSPQGQRKPRKRSGLAVTGAFPTASGNATNWLQLRDRGGGWSCCRRVASGGWKRVGAPLSGFGCQRIRSLPKLRMKIT